MNRLIPVRSGEWANFCCVSAMMASVTYVYGLLRILKESLILSHAIAEMISAIKVWVIWPVSLLAVVSYMKLSDHMLRTRLFHAANSFFVFFFVSFALFIYPNYQSCCFHFGAEIVTNHPSLRYFFMVINNWPCSLFYACSELWTTIMLSVSTWEVTNHITTIEQSKRFYPLYGAFRGCGLMIASVAASYFSTIHESWGMTLNISILSLVISASVLSGALWILTRRLGFNVLNSDISAGSIVKKKKVPSSIIDSFKHILASKIILLITAMILCYGISLNLIEGVWKKAVELEFLGNANQIQHFMGRVFSGVAFFTVLFSIIGVQIFRKIGWRKSALITPTAFLITGILFFLGVVCKDSRILMLWGLPALEMAVYSGALNQVFARSSKNSFFDATKEMLYIPLSAELRTKGKAAAETVGMRFGKGSGALIQQILLTIFTGTNLIGLAPFLGAGFMVVIAVWFYATVSLSRIYEKII